MSEVRELEVFVRPVKLGQDPFGGLALAWHVRSLPLVGSSWTGRRALGAGAGLMQWVPQAGNGDGDLEGAAGVIAAGPDGRLR